jgi:hypothetical protein
LRLVLYLQHGDVPEEAKYWIRSALRRSAQLVLSPHAAPAQ